MKLADFAALGDFAPAGLQATRLALKTAAVSAAAGRIPIAGAAVFMAEDGTLTTITTGCNGRIPADDGPGYPTDHGETAAVRHIDDVSAWDWKRAVFATTLSPCVMCTRTLMHLHSLGLSRITIAESQSFPGRKDLLRPLPGMVMVELESPSAVAMMQHFARRHPWDWAADIGEIPPASVPDITDPAALFTTLKQRGHQAGVFSADGRCIASAADERRSKGGNPVYSAPMLAMGRAGSAINLREHVLVVCSTGPLDLAGFGFASLGACELFRPAVLLCNHVVESTLQITLIDAGIRVLIQSENSGR